MSFQTSGFLRRMSDIECDVWFHRLYTRDGELEGVNRVAEFAVQRPCYALVQGLDRGVGLLGNVSHDRVDHLALVIALLALDDILRRHTAF